MPFDRDSFTAIKQRILFEYLSLFRPLDKTPRHSLIEVFAAVDAGIYHQLLGDLDFLADQLFPDTASGDYLRLHWSDRVPPLYAVAAVGVIRITGKPNSAVPAGLVFTSIFLGLPKLVSEGQRFFQ